MSLLKTVAYHHISGCRALPFPTAEMDTDEMHYMDSVVSSQIYWQQDQSFGWWTGHDKSARDTFRVGYRVQGISEVHVKYGDVLESL